MSNIKLEAYWKQLLLEYQLSVDPRRPTDLTCVFAAEQLAGVVEERLSLAPNVGVGILASFRFLHAADVHLDSPLRGLANQGSRAARVVRAATREALDRLVDLAITENVDLLIIAGDLYDGDWPDYNTGLFFVEQMGRLNSAEIPVYLLHGNHDAESQITKRLELPLNVHVFGSRAPQTFELECVRVALHGQSFHQRDVTENLVPGYPDPVPGAFNIGVLHTALGGTPGHANYAPCSMADLVNKGYDYWALGHVHKHEVLNTHPHVVFPGNLQGRHVRETGPKGACLVTVQDSSIVSLDLVPCDVVRWSKLSVPLDDVDSIESAIDCIRKNLEWAVANEADGRLLASRIELVGESVVHAHLVASEDQLLAEARSIALGLGDEVAWVEKVIVATTSMADPQAQEQRRETVRDLQAMLAGAIDDPELVALFEEGIGEFVKKMPHEVRREPEDPALRSAVAADYRELIDTVAPFLSARLLSQGR